MANNYTEASSLIEIPEDKRDQAQQILTRFIAEQDEDEGTNFDASVEPDGLWIRSNESIDVEQAHLLVKEIVEKLDLPGVHVVAWADTCSRLRPGEFGGGAFAVRKGRDTIWVNAEDEARKQAELS